MSGLKRPEKYVIFESIKPKFKEITEFYTQKVNDYQDRLKQLNEYADALENEISILKGNSKLVQERDQNAFSKIEVLLDNTDKQLVGVPKFVAEFIEEAKQDFKLFGALNGISMGKFGDDLRVWVFGKDNGKNNKNKFANAWVNGCTVEKEKLYEVALPNETFNQDSAELETDVIYLLLDVTSDETKFGYGGSRSDNFKKNLTEKQIKSIDERYWPFAVEVEEEDN